MDSLIFSAEVIVILAAVFAAAYFSERPEFTARHVALTGVMAAAAGVLMMLEIPLPFAPPFYKLDISEVPVLILTFAYGPFSGITCGLLKIVIKILLKGTSSAFVGELANFLICAGFILPAGLIYLKKKTRKRALISLIAGTAVMTAFGSFLNAVYLLPAFSRIYGLPLDAIVGMGTAVNPAVDSVKMLVLLCVVPVNLLKGAVDTVLTMLMYKRLSPVLKR